MYFKKLKALQNAVDYEHSIYTELRIRANGRKSKSPLARYSEQELMIIKDQLRDVIFKKRLKHKLSESDKALINQFPNSYAIAKLRYQEKKRKLSDYLKKD